MNKSAAIILIIILGISFLNFYKLQKTQTTISELRGEIINYKSSLNEHTYRSLKSTLDNNVRQTVIVRNNVESSKQRLENLEKHIYLDTKIKGRLNANLESQKINWIGSTINIRLWKTGGKLAYVINASVEKTGKFESAIPPGKYERIQIAGLSLNTDRDDLTVSQSPAIEKHQLLDVVAKPGQAIQFDDLSYQFTNR